MNNKLTMQPHTIILTITSSPLELMTSLLCMVTMVTLKLCWQKHPAPMPDFPWFSFTLSVLVSWVFLTPVSALILHHLSLSFLSATFLFLPPLSHSFFVIKRWSSVWNEDFSFVLLHLRMEKHYQMEREEAKTKAEKERERERKRGGLPRQMKLMWAYHIWNYVCPYIGVHLAQWVIRIKWSCSQAMRRTYQACKQKLYSDRAGLFSQL